MLEFGAYKGTMHAVVPMFLKVDDAAVTQGTLCTHNSPIVKNREGLFFVKAVKDAPPQADLIGKQEVIRRHKYCYSRIMDPGGC